MFLCSVTDLQPQYVVRAVLSCPAAPCPVLGVWPAPAGWVEMWRGGRGKDVMVWMVLLKGRWDMASLCWLPYLNSCPDVKRTEIFSCDNHGSWWVGMGSSEFVLISADAFPVALWQVAWILSLSASKDYLHTYCVNMSQGLFSYYLWNALNRKCAGQEFISFSTVGWQLQVGTGGSYWS